MQTCTGCGAHKSAALDDDQAGGFLAGKLLGAPGAIRWNAICKGGSR